MADQGFIDSTAPSISPGPTRGEESATAEEKLFGQYVNWPGKIPQEVLDAAWDVKSPKAALPPIAADGSFVAAELRLLAFNLAFGDSAAHFRVRTNPQLAAELRVAMMLADSSSRPDASPAQSNTANKEDIDG